MSNPFKPLVARMKKLKFPLSDEGHERVTFKKGISIFSPAKLDALEKHLGGAVPADVRLLVDQTLGFCGSDPTHGDAEVDLDFFDRGLEDARALGFGDLFRIYDYGNGDGLYLEPGKVNSRLWWLGHDPWIVNYVAESLFEYVERCVEYLEAAAAEQTRDEAGDDDDEDRPPLKPPYEPRWKIAPSSPQELLPQVRELGLADWIPFLEGLPANAWVYPLQGKQRPIELSIPDLSRLTMITGALRRQGELVAIIPDLKPERPAEDPVEPFLSRALAFESMGLSDQADSELKKALAIAPENPRVLSWMADLAKRRGR